MKPIDRILPLLKKARKGSADPSKGIVIQYSGLCPAHDDREPSLSVAETRDGAILVCCQAGCKTEEVLQAWGLTMKNLYPDDQGSTKPRRRSSDANGQAVSSPSTGCTLDQYARLKQLPVEFLSGLDLTEIAYCGAPAVRMPYVDAGGQESAVRFRTGLSKGPDGIDGRFRWRKGSKPCLYGLWRLQDYPEDSCVIVEGESDCQTLWFHDIPAVGLPGATQWNESRDAGHLERFETVYVVVEPDKGGEGLMASLSGSSLAGKIKLVELDGVKDPSELHLRDPEAFFTRWQAALGKAVPLERAAELLRRQTRTQSFAECEELAHSTDILGLVVETMRCSGVVGEERLIKLVYLAMVSRLFDRPVSLAVKGGSACGKSFSSGKVVGLFNPSAYRTLTAMSAKALVYSDDNLSHRMLVVFEASGIQTGIGAYLVRSLLSEGQLRYETVDKTRDGMRPRSFEKDGPTGLIVTTTALQLHPENETRLLSVPVDDSPAQTRAILEAIAGGGERAIDLERWHALDRWIESGETRVVIPFADALARRISPTAPRIRRDFTTVLSLIKAHALIHQVNRLKDKDGRIVATLDDYAVVRDLVADLLADGVELSVPASVRQVVEATIALHTPHRQPVQQSQLVERLHLDKSVVSRHVRAAVNSGYLFDEKERQVLPSQLVPGEPLPTEQDVLPTVEQLRAACCAVADNLGDDHPSPHGQTNRSSG